MLLFFLDANAVRIQKYFKEYTITHYSTDYTANLVSFKVTHASQFKALQYRISTWHTQNQEIRLLPFQVLE